MKKITAFRGKTTSDIQVSHLNLEQNCDWQVTSVHASCPWVPVKRNNPPWQRSSRQDLKILIHYCMETLKRFCYHEATCQSSSNPLFCPLCPSYLQAFWHAGGKTATAEETDALRLCLHNESRHIWIIQQESFCWWIDKRTNYTVNQSLLMSHKAKWMG